MNYYIADTHFGHANIIRYDNRPFNNTYEMDKAMIDRWNAVVTEDDTVYILGDFAWYNKKRTCEILDILKGHKILITGNHDVFSPAINEQFDSICDYLEIKDGGERVVMSHYPMLFWNGQFGDSVHLYGHVHNSHQYNCCESWRRELQQLQALPMRMFNVGCMMKKMDYTPCTLREIIE